MAGRTKEPMQHVGDARPPEKKPQMHMARNCEAHGCPLNGTMTNHTGPGGPWWCYIHVNCDASELQPATKAIRERMDTVERIRSLYKELSAERTDKARLINNEIVKLRGDLAKAARDAIAASKAAA